MFFAANLDAPMSLAANPRRSDVLRREPRRSDVLGREPRRSDVLGREPRRSDVLGREPRHSDVLGRQPRCPGASQRRSLDTINHRDSVRVVGASGGTSAGGTSTGGTSTNGGNAVDHRSPPRCRRSRRSTWRCSPGVARRIGRCERPPVGRVYGSLGLRSFCRGRLVRGPGAPRGGEVDPRARRPGSGGRGSRGPGSR